MRYDYSCQTATEKLKFLFTQTMNQAGSETHATRVFRYFRRFTLQLNTIFGTCDCARI